ncbi:unnamed protein product [Adineta steineri]|uniref:G-protein coupled receptors family 1 profile domain-containing protein n=1 Tax=Adineta steineri TaxID=433720 RepID=A0A815KMD2_9BILA|nr:unnamed protein product [Adineta steineri]
MSSINVIIPPLNTAASIISFILLCILFALGAVGLIFNIIVFTRPSLRREPCSLYFLSSTCINLFVIFLVIPLRILSNSFYIDLAYYNIGICKVEFFAFYSIRTISCWLIGLACADRFLHSTANPDIRRISSLKTAKITIGSIIIIISILYCHMIVYMSIKYAINQSGNVVSSCESENDIHRTFLSILYMILYSLCPSFLMILFGCLTLNNIRQRRHIISRITGDNRIARRTNIQLLRMLTAQVFVIIITTLPQSINQLYKTLTANTAKDTLRLAEENLSSKIFTGMTFFAHSSSFYLFTWSGSIFRKELYKFLRQHLYPNRNRVHINHDEI